MENVSIEQLKGLTISEVGCGIDKLLFTCTNGDKYMMKHMQDCCEVVYLEDITEDWKQILTGSTVYDAYESRSSYSEQNEVPKNHGIDASELRLYEREINCGTWTFYRIVTNQGTVVIRWYGFSNGYYSETAELYKL
jgi:hypothetical protein